MITYISQFYHRFKNSKSLLFRNSKFISRTRIWSRTQEETGRFVRFYNIFKYFVEVPTPGVEEEPMEYCVRCSKELEGAVVEVMGKCYHQVIFIENLVKLN
jgi:hypothetical protein